VHVTFVDSGGRVVRDEAQIRAAVAAAEGVRLACRLVDTHPDELTTTAYAAECRSLFEGDEAVTIEEIVGEELLERGYGGIYNVGRCATEPPRLLILTYEPPPPPTTTMGDGVAADDGGEDGGEDGKDAPPPPPGGYASSSASPRTPSGPGRYGTTTSLPSTRERPSR